MGHLPTLTKRTSRTSTSWPKPASTTAATAACISGPSLGVGFPKGYEGQINSTHKDPIRTGSLYPAFDLALTIEQKKKFVVKEMLVKPGEWFTQEVIAQGNHIVIKVNDKTTVDFIDEKNHPKGPFALQQHHDGSVVEFRRIEVKGLPAAQEAGFVPLFNGKDLTGWGDITHYWHVEGNALVGEVPPQGLPKNMFLSPNLPLPLKDFELRLEVKMIKGNSGIQVRSKRVENNGFTTMLGPQVEIAHGAKWIWSSLVTEPSGEPSLSAVVDKVLLKPADFNEMYIRCVGKHITVTLNGTVTVDADFPTMPAEGLIGLQIHKSQPGMRVEFRNIRLKELKPGAGVGRPRSPCRGVRSRTAAVSADGKQPYVDRLDKIPAGPFKIIYIEGSGLRNALDDKALAELAPGLTKLQTIYGNDTKFTGTGFAPLIKYGELAGLDLYNGSISDAGLEVLCQFPKLWDLSIEGNPVTNAGLVHVGRMQGLVQLGLVRTKITDDGLVHLAKCPKLLRIHLSATAITDEGLRHLAPLKLTSISLAGNKEQITDKALFYLKSQTNLEDISLQNTHVTDAGLAHLTGLRAMERLPLDKTKVTGKGLGQLEVLPKLVMLHLADTAVDDGAVPQISRLKGLLDLDLTNTKVTPAGLRRLQDALPKCKIVPPPPKTKNTGADRRAVERFLKLGGQVQIRVGAEVREPTTSKELPAEDFKITIAVADKGQATDDDLKLLADCTSLANVRIGGGKITDAGLAHLRGLTHLTDFLLLNAGITDEGIKILHNLPLRAVALNGCKITRATLGPWPDLFHLEMNATSVNDAGLKKIGQYRKLEDLAWAPHPSTMPA